MAGESREGPPPIKSDWKVGSSETFKPPDGPPDPDKEAVIKDTVENNPLSAEAADKIKRDAFQKPPFIKSAIARAKAALGMGSKP